MNTIYMLLGIYGKPRLTLAEVCEATGISAKTAYNKRSASAFPVPMTGKPLTADIRDVAAYLDELRNSANPSRVEYHCGIPVSTAKRNDFVNGGGNGGRRWERP